ncbi:unnamed protein product [Ectocarpus sp. 8 AP-2014]
MSDKISRGRWASRTDALDLVADLERGQTTVKWKSDTNHFLRSIMWASPEQIVRQDIRWCCHPRQYVPY